MSRERMEIASSKFEQIVEMANEGIWTLGADHLTDYINERGAEILGYAPEEMIGRSPMDYIMPESRGLAEKRFRENLKGQTGRFELHVQRKDGSEAWISASTRPIFSPSGEYEGAMNMFSDITERKLMYEELHRSQQMLQFVLDSIPDRVFWKDRDSTFLGCNKNFARDAGLENPSDLVGRNDHDMTWRESANAYRADDREVIESGEPKINFEESQVLDDGTVRWLRTSKVPLRDAVGDIIGVLGTYEDITNLKLAERKLKEYAQQLERSNEELQQFAYVASHDLKEPLRMVTLSLDIMRRKLGGELGQVNEYVITAVEGAERMRRLINDLLMYSRVETQAREFNAVDMNVVVREVISDLRVAISESGAEIVARELPTVLGDEVQMKQLLLNLISNAIKYRGQTPPRIEVPFSEEEDEYLFSVSDNGIGIDPRYIPSMFKMFYRLHSRDEYSGSGIGLAVCKKIVERHGGRIWVESDGKSGSTFRFTLPSLSAPVSKLYGQLA